MIGLWLTIMKTKEDICRLHLITKS